MVAQVPTMCTLYNCFNREFRRVLACVGFNMNLIVRDGSDVTVWEFRSGAGPVPNNLYKLEVSPTGPTSTCQTCLSWTFRQQSFHPQRRSRLPQISYHGNRLSGGSFPSRSTP